MDLYQIHRSDFHTTIEETMETLHDRWAYFSSLLDYRMAPAESGGTGRVAVCGDPLAPGFDG